jgi:site-specific DNA-adenine methylase
MVKSNKEKLIKEIEELIIHEGLLKYFKKKEKTRLENAVYFVLKNVFSYLGAGGTLRTSIFNIQLKKEGIKKEINVFHEKLQNSIILNKDFKDFLKSISIGHESNYKRVFIYCDPPYLNSSNHYGSNWTQSDLIDLIEILKNYEKRGSNFIISEKESNEINQIAKEFNLNIIEIQKITYMNKSEKSEIILTNLNKKNLLF